MIFPFLSSIQSAFRLIQLEIFHRFLFWFISIHMHHIFALFSKFYLRRYSKSQIKFIEIITTILQINFFEIIPWLFSLNFRLVFLNRFYLLFYRWRRLLFFLILATLTPAILRASDSWIIALAVSFQTMGFFAIASFLR